MNYNQIVLLDQWLDREVGPQYVGHDIAQDWARIAKIIEELGEAIQAFIGTTGQNPRKGITDDLDHVLDELADVEITAVLAIQHFTKNYDQTMTILHDRWNRVMKRAGKMNG